MKDENVFLKECLIVSKNRSTLKNRYIKHSDSRYNLANLNKKLAYGNEIQFFAPGKGNIKIENDYCLLLEDELDNSAQLIVAVADSKILEATVLCNDVDSIDYFISNVEKKPLFI